MKFLSTCSNVDCICFHPAFDLVFDKKRDFRCFFSILFEIIAVYLQWRKWNLNQSFSCRLCVPKEFGKAIQQSMLQRKVEDVVEVGWRWYQLRIDRQLQCLRATKKVSRHSTSLANLHFRTVPSRYILKYEEAELQKLFYRFRGEKEHEISFVVLPCNRNTDKTCFLHQIELPIYFAIGSVVFYVQTTWKLHWYSLQFSTETQKVLFSRNFAINIIELLVWIVFLSVE